MADALLAQLHPPHFYEVLRDLGDPLLALVDREVWPVYEFGINLESMNSRPELA